VSTTDRWATFDCYGTLIDWNGGIRRALGSDELLDGYHELEPQVEAENANASYREVMTEVSRRLGAEDPEALARSLPSWEPFPEVPAALAEVRRRGWSLAILSNSDPPQIEASKARLGSPFGATVVAGEIGSYKPAHRHWEAFYNAHPDARGHHVHVAQSHSHDIAATFELGLPSIWINRLAERRQPAPTRELPDLRGLAEVLDELVPAVS
jgi:2-haloacid dehalogenase